MATNTCDRDIGRGTESRRMDRQLIGVSEERTENGK